MRHVGFDVAFDVASTLSIGDSGNTQRLMATGQNNPLSTDVYATTPFHKYASNTNILQMSSTQAAVFCTKNTFMSIPLIFVYMKSKT